MAIIIKIKKIILDILFPPLCLGCKKLLKSDEEKHDFICNECQLDIVIHNSFFCPKCKARVPDTSKICHKNSGYLLAATTDYQNQAIKNLIWSFKYQGWQNISNFLKCLIEKYLDKLQFNFKNYVLVPIPLHKYRQKERGFNQSEIIAKNVAEKLNLKIILNCLVRTQDTKSQAETKNIKQREENIKNCFIIENPSLIEKKNIILVDDVHTSGSTISEAARQLRSAGAHKIIAFVIAKT